MSSQCAVFVIGLYTVIEFHKQNVTVPFSMPTMKNLILGLSGFQFLTSCSICNIGFLKNCNTLLNCTWTV